MIINPKSAGGSTELRWAKIASDLRSHFGAFTVKFTRKQGDGIELAREAAKYGSKFMIVWGGDGKINEVDNGHLQSGEGD